MQVTTRDLHRNGQWDWQQCGDQLGAWVDFYTLNGEKTYGQIVQVCHESMRLQVQANGTLHHFELV